MKPGRGTIDTLTDLILGFETSRRADKERVAARRTAEEMVGFTAPRCLDTKCVRLFGTALGQFLVTHRELRRSARRLAKLALNQQKELDDERSKVALYVDRIQRLENEIDRLDLLVKATS